MIEITNSNIYYKKRPKKRRFFAWLLIFIIGISFYFYYKFAITNTIVDVSSSYAYSYSTDAVNTAVINTLKDEIKYSDLITVEKNESGDIILMSTNSYKVNLINKEVALATTEILNKYVEKGIPIPIMAFSGIKIISGYGKEIYFKIIGVSGVTCDFESVFKSVGVNQTLHSIYVKVNSVLEINVPLSSETVSTSTSILISETVLVGKVPQTYLNGGLFNGVKT